jgi:hypothetical protein
MPRPYPKEFPEGALALVRQGEDADPRSGAAHLGPRQSRMSRGAAGTDSLCSDWREAGSGDRGDQLQRRR